MKILLINNHHHIRGGADVVYFNTMELLKKHGHVVFNFALDSDDNIKSEYSEFFPRNINYRDLSLLNKLKATRYFINNTNSSERLKEVINIFNPDIAHIHLFLGGLTTSIVKVLNNKNIPVVHTAHDYRLICPAYTFMDKNNNICESCKDGFYLRCSYKRCSLEGKFSHSLMLSIDAYYRKYINKPIKLIDHFIFVSYFSQKKHIQFENAYNTKSSIIYNFSPNKLPPSHTHSNYILYYGRLSREKGIDLLIESAKQLKFELKIVGNGPMLTELLNKQNSNIKILGYKTGNELWKLIQNASFIILPSELYENNPLTIVESFSFGKPVIGSDIGGISELLKDNRGFLFQTKNIESLLNAINQALSVQYNEYKIMSDNVYKFAKENFSEEIHYSSLINIYKSIIDAKKNNK